MAGVNITRTLAILMALPIGWFVWVGPTVREYLERMNRRLQ